MGVQGLWSLVSPCRRPIQLETLGGKRLAIDASTWLYQFQMATRDRKTGVTLEGAHIMGTFRRIMKLMFYGIKPVFVFDGDAPVLKKRTIEKRRRRKEGAGRDLAKTAQQLLAAQMRSAMAQKELERLQSASNGQEPTEGAGAPKVGDDPVYLDDLEEPSPVKIARRDALRDDYALPKIAGPLESRAKASDPRIATEEELREFIEELRPEDLDINSPFFGNLPTEVKYEILGDLRIKTRQVNHRRVQQMRDLGTAVDFSRAQIDNLMERNRYTQRLLDVTDELGRAAIAIPTRVAGQRNREYILVKQDVSQGGGWALGVKNLQPISNEPITIDTTTDESVGSHTDTDDFEEVGAASSSPAKDHSLPTPDVEARRLLAMEAVRARYTSTSSAVNVDPFLDLPIASSSRSLFTSSAAVDDDDAALQQALFDSTTAAAGSPELPHLPLASTSRFAARPSSHASNPSPQSIMQPPQPPAFHENDTDDEMEYVDIPPPSKDKGKVKAVEDAPAGHAPVAHEAMVLSDDEGSDAFEDVVAVTSNGEAPVPKVPPPSTAPAPARPLPAAVLIPRHRSPSPPPAARSPSPPPKEVSRTIFDTILPSDSDSEAEEALDSSPAKSPTKASPARLPAAFPRLSPSPDPFEVFDAKQKALAVEQATAPAEPVKAKDFALEEDEDFFEPVADAVPAQAKFAPPEYSTATSLPPILAVPSSLAALSPIRRSLSPAPRPISPAPLAPAAKLASTSTSRRSLSPAHLPSPLPPLEKAKEAIEAEEAAVLPDTIAQLPSPRLHTPGPPSHSPLPAVHPPNQPHQSTSSSSAAFAAPPVAEPVVMYEDDLLAQTNGAPAHAVVFDKAVGKSSNANGDDSPEEFLSDWSRSPSPPGRRGSSDALFLPQDYDSDEEAEEAIRALQNEENAYAEIAAQLRSEKLEKIRAEAEADMGRLEKQRNTDLRNADGVTRAMATDIKNMLALFGIPFIDAPGEAEAECASLLSRQLVDGIVSDDSDVFLFGGSRIYRNMFNEAKYVECYLLADLERELGLDRDKLVRLAYLLGSDYTEGLPGVGPVLSMELLEEFPGKEGLKRFRDWWAKVQSGKDVAETTTTWRKRFRKGHKDLILDSIWPNPEVAQAYYRPTVHDSDERFSWGGIDLDGLRHYLARSLGWPQHKSDSILLPLIKREQERKAGKLVGQANLTDFFDYSAGTQPLKTRMKPKFASKRLQNVVQNWKRTQVTDDAKIEEIEEGKQVEVEEPAQPKGAKKRKATKAPPAKAPRKKKSTAASRKRSAQAQRDARAAANDGVYSSEEDLYSDKEDGGAAAEPGKKRAQPKRKASGSKKRVAVPSTEEDEA
ncbi:hypothetical protein JCM11251_004518 [Rhodosporidiobolus azoricus]